jgi:ABC-type phosphate/phosphonate transport system permease subunit
VQKCVLSLLFKLLKLVRNQVIYGRINQNCFISTTLQQRLHFLLLVLLKNVFCPNLCSIKYQNCSVSPVSTLVTFLISIWGVVFLLGTSSPIAFFSRRIICPLNLNTPLRLKVFTHCSSPPCVLLGSSKQCCLI